MHYTALPTDPVKALRAGGPDAYGLAAERGTSAGAGTPCRHCLKNVPEGEEMLILAHRPFPTLQPYAETGPLFLCAQDCARGGGGHAPEILATSPSYLIKGYGPEDRILYGTGAVVRQADVAARAAARLSDPAVAYVHVRSASNNCYLLRIDRG